MNSEYDSINVEFWRGDLVESIHRAHYCIVDNTGELLDQGGNPDLITYLRSSTKPLQAMAVILSGAARKFNITDAELAIICGSHGGEKYQTETVHTILSRAGLSADDLGCGTHSPLDKSARMALYKNNDRLNELHHNCSGKHAGMMLSAICLGEPIENYLSLNSAVQQRVNLLITELSGIDADEMTMGIDGCSVPAHAMMLKSAALAYARLINPEGLPDEIAEAALRVGRAMRSYPEMVGANKDRICTDLIRLGRVFELIGKAGAEGYYSAGWRDSKTGRGIGMAIKVEDGAERARNPLIINILQKYGILPQSLSQNLIQYAAKDTLNNRGNKVGQIVIRFSNS